MGVFGLVCSGKIGNPENPLIRKILLQTKLSGCSWALPDLLKWTSKFLFVFTPGNRPKTTVSLTADALCSFF